MLILVSVTAGIGVAAGVIWLTCLRYVALGDSLAAGVGSLTLTGYVRRFSWLLLRRRRRWVATTNLGRFGMTSTQLLVALKTSETNDT